MFKGDLWVLEVGGRPGHKFELRIRFGATDETNIYRGRVYSSLRGPEKEHTVNDYILDKR